MVPKKKAENTKGKINNRVKKDRTTNRYVRNSITSTKIISPDDQNVKLTETMKKACQGKTIYYNSQHVVESSGDKLKAGVIGGNNSKKRRFEKLMPQMPNITFKRGDRRLCGDLQVKIDNF